MMNDFKYDKLNSFDVLKKLHNQGFTRLYLFSESEPEKGDIPPKYVTLVSRDNAVTALADYSTDK
ncbi:hypothetical protein GAMM_200001 [Gammaproteobacteria bacterium]